MKRKQEKITGRRLLLALMLGVTTMASAQRISLSLEDARVEQVLEEITKQTGLSLAYSNQVVDLNRKVSLHVTDTELAQVLQQLTAGTKIAYEVRDGKIYLFERGQRATALLQQTKKKITGTVVDAQGEPIIGANIVEKGTSNGTITDLAGNFSLQVATVATLEVSYIGYKTAEVKPAGQDNLQIVLHEDSESLDEVVVVGYGTMRKRDLTGAMTQVKAETMQAYTVSNPIQALQGRVPGVTIRNNTGAPEGNFTIRVRGTNSIQGGNDPLYVVDGMPVNPSSINSQDIESVEVLKDASATAIYGSRGANGVILITTKRGKTGASNVTYDGSWGVQSLIKKIDVLDASEWATLVNEQQLNDVGKAYFTPEQVAAFGKGTDWQDLVYSSAPVQNHNLTVSSGNERTQVLMSGSLMLREGIVAPSAYNKYNLRGNINHKFNEHLDAQLIMSYARTAKRTRNNAGGNRGGTIHSAAIAAPPTLKPYNEDGSYNNLMTAYPFLSNALINPINRINEQDSRTKANLINTNTALTYRPIKGLSLKASIGIENLDYRQDDYTTSKHLNGTNSASVGQTNELTIINENIANYNTTISENHRIDLTGGFTYQQYESKYMGMSGNQFISDTPGSDQIGSAENFGTPSTSYSKWVLMSYLARANYSYKGRYIATVSFRADGSSRYSDGDKWGYFPAAALAWRISDEPFLREVDAISDMKFRLGYGETGSTAISPYATLNMLSQGKTPINGSVATFYAASTRLPSNLKWETTAQWNVGVDLSLFKSRLRITADYYKKMTRDLLNTVSLPGSTGYDTTIRNIGKMGNQGVELLVEGEVFQTKDFTWTLSANFALNRNKVEKLYGGKDVYGGGIGVAYIEDFVNLVREGEPLGVFYTYKEAGYDENGDLKYEDRDGNGILNNDDKFITGNPHPDFTYGLNSDIRWKDFEFSFFFQGSQGNDVFNIGETANLDYGVNLNVRRDVLYSHWRANNTAEQNAAAKYPKITNKLTMNYSDRYVEDGSYLRLKNISVGYNLPVRKWAVGDWLKGVKIYASAQNLLTFTGYSGRDPEVSSLGENVRAGIDYWSYPNVKSFTFGAKVQF